MDIHKLDGASLQMRIPSGHMAVGHQKCGFVKGIRHPSMPVCAVHFLGLFFRSRGLGSALLVLGWVWGRFGTRYVHRRFRA